MQKKKFFLQLLKEKEKEIQVKSREFLMRCKMLSEIITVATLKLKSIHVFSFVLADLFAFYYYSLAFVVYSYYIYFLLDSCLTDCVVVLF